MPSLVETVISLEVGAEELWDNEVILFQPYAMEQILLPDNANTLAVQAFLHMCELPFETEHRANAEFMSPSGKVPFIKCGAFVVSEFEFIVQFVSNKGITLTDDLLPEQKADMRAYMSIIHTVLANAELYICWCDQTTYNEVTKPRNGSVYPWPLNHLQTWSKKAEIIKKLKLLGWYQKSIENVYEEVEICCQALSERLEGKEYFFGSKPTQLDALLYGHLSAILSTPNCCDLFKNIINNSANLRSHCKRIQTLYVTSNVVHDIKRMTQLSNTTVTNGPGKLVCANIQLVKTKNASLDSDSSSLNGIENIESNDGFVIGNLTKTLSQLLKTNGTLLGRPANDERTIEITLPVLSVSQMLNSNDSYVLSNVSSANRSMASDDRSDSSDDIDVNLYNTKSNSLVNDVNSRVELISEVFNDNDGELLVNLYKIDSGLSVTDEKSRGEGNIEIVHHHNLGEPVENSLTGNGEEH